MKQILLKDSSVQKPECIQYITSGFSIQISCPVPDCKVSVPMSVMEKYLGIRSTTTTTSAPTTTNKPAAANIVTPSNGGDQPHQESFSKKCPGCEKVVSFVPDKHTSANDINISHSVDCGNGHFFCWECTSLQGHAPLACDLWEKWHEKCSKMDTIGKEKTYNIINLTFQTQRSSFWDLYFNGVAQGSFLGPLIFIFFSSMDQNCFTQMILDTFTELLQFLKR